MRSGSSATGNSFSNLVGTGSNRHVVGLDVVISLFSSSCPIVQFKSKKKIINFVQKCKIKPNFVYFVYAYSVVILQKLFSYSLCLFHTLLQKVHSQESGTNIAEKWIP